MRSFVFGLLCGALVATFATAIALELLFDAGPPRTIAMSATNVAAIESRAAVDSGELAKRLEGASDRALAEALDAAAFDRSWAGVNAVGESLRSRTAPKTDPLTSLADAAIFGPKAKSVPLLALEVEIARRRLVLDLRSRDNAATKLLDHASEEDAVRQLVDLFTAEAKPAAYDRVREDAALVLAFGATDRGREVLARAMHEGPHERAEIAARALGESEDDRAFSLLGDLASEDRDPEVRRLAASGLGYTSAVAHGGEVVAALAKAARQDADAGVRLAALATLGKADLARSAAARSALSDELTAPSEPVDVRLAAIAALRAYFDRARSLPAELSHALLDTLGTEHDGPVRREIALSLADTAPASSLTDLEAALSGTQDPSVHDALEKAVAAVRARGEPPP